MNKNFSNKLLNWYQKTKRKLPWRGVSDPYKIWLSEIIMQQTQIKQGTSYYLKILDAFPTVIELAEAEQDELLVLWQGLGYYSRARNMHESAKYVVEELNGIFPKSYKQLIKLKGVGDYTASAISSIENNELRPALDGNLLRVFTRLFGIEAPIDKASGKRLVKEKAQKYMPADRPGDYNQALMDFGASVCCPKKPNCQNCLFNTDCIAFQTGKVLQLPVKSSKIKKTTRYIHYFLIQSEGETPKSVIRKRTGNGIWRGLYDFISLEYSQKTDELNAISDFHSKYPGTKNESINFVSKEYKQELSHQKLYVRFYALVLPSKEVNAILKAESSTKTVDKDEFSTTPFPQLLNKFLLENEENVFS